MGNNVRNLLEDQRSKPGDTVPYPYPRVSGAFGIVNPKADIGAYEKQSDEIFDAGFDGCLSFD